MAKLKQYAIWSGGEIIALVNATSRSEATKKAYEQAKMGIGIQYILQLEGAYRYPYAYRVTEYDIPG